MAGLKCEKSRWLHRDFLIPTTGDGVLPVLGVTGQARFPNFVRQKFMSNEKQLYCPETVFQENCDRGNNRDAVDSL